jgi:hypothetical protein
MQTAVVGKLSGHVIPRTSDGQLSAPHPPAQKPGRFDTVMRAMAPNVNPQAKRTFHEIS